MDEDADADVTDHDDDTG